MESISKIAKINLRPHRKGKKDDHKGIGKGRGGGREKMHIYKNEPIIFLVQLRSPMRRSTAWRHALAQEATVPLRGK